jgi:regulator of sigma E protease
VTITVTPDSTAPWTDPFIISPTEPLEVPGLGLAYAVRPRIATIAPDSPAAKAGLKPGDTIGALTFTLARTKKPETFTLDDKAMSWPAVFSLLQLQFDRNSPVELAIDDSDTPVAITPEADPTWFHPLRGLQFNRLRRMLPPQAPAAAIRRGFDDTVTNILSTYATIRSLFQGRVSARNLGGPIEIAQVAYHSADSGFKKLVYFLGFLSINLAVLNFLPVPPLDGGQMVFLIAEKIRGRPLPESALSAGTWTGILLLLMLMVFVMYQDVARIVTRYFW